MKAAVKEFVTYLPEAAVDIAALRRMLIYCEGREGQRDAEWRLPCSTMSFIPIIFNFAHPLSIHRRPERTSTGFRNALTKTFNDYGRKNKLLKGT